MIGTNSLIKELLKIGREEPDFEKALEIFRLRNPDAHPTDSQVSLARSAFLREVPGPGR